MKVVQENDLKSTNQQQKHKENQLSHIFRKGCRTIFDNKETQGRYHNTNRGNYGISRLMIMLHVVVFVP